MTQDSSKTGTATTNYKISYIIFITDKVPLLSVKRLDIQRSTCGIVYGDITSQENMSF